MPGQHILVEGTEQDHIANLHGISEILRQQAEKSIELEGKV